MTQLIDKNQTVEKIDFAVFTQKQKKKILHETFCTIVEVCSENRKYLKEIVGLAMQNWTIDNCIYVLTGCGRDPDSVNDCLGFDLDTGQRLRKRPQPDPADLPKTEEIEEEIEQETEDEK